MSNFLQNFLFDFVAVSFFNMFVTFPIIFNFFIIPKIEKQIGRKLEFVQPYPIPPAPKFAYKWIGSNMDVSFYILVKYLMIKITGKPSEQTKPIPKWTLQKVNYQVESASFFTIFMSFLVIIHDTCWMILAILYSLDCLRL